MISPVIATFLRRWWFRKHLWQLIRAAGMGVAIAAAAYWTAWTAWELARAGGDPMLRDLVRGDREAKDFEDFLGKLGGDTLEE